MCLCLCVLVYMGESYGMCVQHVSVCMCDYDVTVAFVCICAYLNVCASVCCLCHVCRLCQCMQMCVSGILCAYVHRCVMCMHAAGVLCAAYVFRHVLWVCCLHALCMHRCVMCMCCVYVACVCAVAWAACYGPSLLSQPWSILCSGPCPVRAAVGL